MSGERPATEAAGRNALLTVHPTGCTWNDPARMLRMVEVTITKSGRLHRLSEGRSSVPECQSRCVPGIKALVDPCEVRVDRWCASCFPGVRESGWSR